MTNPTSNTPSVRRPSSYQQVLKDFISEKNFDVRKAYELQLDANYHDTATVVWIFLSHPPPSVKGNIQSVKLYLKRKDGQSCPLMNPIELPWSTYDTDDLKPGTDFIVRCLSLAVREDNSDDESSKAVENVRKVVNISKAQWKVGKVKREVVQITPASNGKQRGITRKRIVAKPHLDGLIASRDEYDVHVELEFTKCKGTVKANLRTESDNGTDEGASSIYLE